MKNPDKSDDKITDNYGEKWVLNKRDSEQMKVKDKTFKCEFRLLLGGSSRNAKPTTYFALISNPFRPSYASYFEIRQKTLIKI